MPLLMLDTLLAASDVMFFFWLLRRKACASAAKRSSLRSSFASTFESSLSYAALEGTPETLLMTLTLLVAPPRPPYILIDSEGWYVDRFVMVDLSLTMLEVFDSSIYSRFWR